MYSIELPVYKFYQNSFLIDVVGYRNNSLEYAIIRHSGLGYNKMLDFPVFELRNLREFDWAVRNAGE